MTRQTSTGICGFALATVMLIPESAQSRPFPLFFISSPHSKARLSTNALCLCMCVFVYKTFSSVLVDSSFWRLHSLFTFDCNSFPFLLRFKCIRFKLQILAIFYFSPPCPPHSNRRLETTARRFEFVCVLHIYFSCFMVLFFF